MIETVLIVTTALIIGIVIGSQICNNQKIVEKSNAQLPQEELKKIDPQGVNHTKDELNKDSNNELSEYYFKKVEAQILQLQSAKQDEKKVSDQASEDNTQKRLSDLKTKLTSRFQEREINNLIGLAIADGVVSPNERSYILSKATEYFIDCNDVNAQIEKQIKAMKIVPETRLIDVKKEKGNLFEAYVVSKFDKKYFTLKEWAGDKYTNGIYAETTIHPDLRYLFKLREIKIEFAVECKYRSDYYKNGINWAKEYQMKNYNKFEHEYKIPVFVVLGVGGNPDTPLNLYVIPLNDIKYPFLSIAFLEKYKKEKTANGNFFFNHKTNCLA